MPLMKAIPPYLARTRLKSNLFALFITLLVRTIFTPYLTIRRGLVWIADEYLQRRRGGQISWAGQGFRIFEYILMGTMLWNIVESSLAIRYPLVTKSTPGGKSMTPAKISSPITRSYGPIISTTPSQNPGPSIQSHAITSTPTPRQSTTNSPFSPRRSQLGPDVQPSPSKTGLFFDPSLPSSPSRIGQPPQKDPPPPASQSLGGDFVLVDRTEREWAENALRGVRGKTGRITGY